MSKLKLLVLAAVALSALAAATSSASALTAELSPGGSFTSVSLGKVTFDEELAGIECNLTLRGTLATRVELAAGRHLGEVTEVRWANCVGGNVERVLGLNWELNISAVLHGALTAEPNNLFGILFHVVGAAFNLRPFFELVECLFTGSAGALLGISHLPEEGAEVYTSNLITLLPEVVLIFVRGSGGCPESGVLTGRLRLAPLQTITVTEP